MRRLLLLAAVLSATAINIGFSPPSAPQRRPQEKQQRQRPAPAQPQTNDLGFVEEEEDEDEESEDEAELPERRFDEDGGAYTREEFLRFYGKKDGEHVWSAAEVVVPEVACAVEVAEATKQTALQRLKKSAMAKIADLRAACNVAKEAAANATATLTDMASQFATFREKSDRELTAAEERAAEAERVADEALAAAEEQASGRREAEAAVEAASAVALAAEEAAARIESSKEGAAAASAVALAAAEAKVSEQTALAAEATKAAKAAEATRADEVSAATAEARAATAAAAAAEAKADSLRQLLEAAQADATEAREALEAAEAAATLSAEEVGVWRQRARTWQRRAGLWRRRAQAEGGAGGAAAASDEAGVEALAEALADAQGSQRMMQGVAVLALAEASMFAIERDDATQKWKELLGAAPVAGPAAHDAAQQASLEIAMLRGRSASVWSEAEAWAVEELSRLKSAYPSCFSSEEDGDDATAS